MNILVQALLNDLRNGSKSATSSVNFGNIDKCAATCAAAMDHMNSILHTPKAVRQFMAFVNQLAKNFKQVPWGNPQTTLAVCQFTMHATDVHNTLIDKLCLENSHVETAAELDAAIKAKWDQLRDIKLVCDVAHLKGLFLLMRKMRKHAPKLVPKGNNFQKMADYYHFLQRVHLAIPKLCDLSNRKGFNDDDSDSD